MAFRGPTVWLWRWRRNPLRRRADKVEAWVLLAAWTVTVLAGVLAGLVAAGSVERGLARERAEWRPTAARLAGGVPGPADRGASDGDRVWVEATWSAPDGSRHSGRVLVSPDSAGGNEVTVWTDPAGRLVGPPVTASRARLRSALIGVLAGASTAAVPFVAGRAVRCRLEYRRVRQWDVEWARFEPRWRGRTG
ncbi:hypothetical protein ACL02U_11740 [Streptomyces sp. MS06]|uniref:Rv1733c family protein n=1 Tax=Streptomyces sp. MS06 TaxID=3385974 RepID=UPI0039A24028